MENFCDFLCMSRVVRLIFELFIIIISFSCLFSIYRNNNNILMNGKTSPITCYVCLHFNDQDNFCSPIPHCTDCIDKM